jgi:hypothetical protein
VLLQSTYIVACYREVLSIPDVPICPPTPCHCSGCGDVIIDTQHGVHGRLSSSTAGFRWAATWSKSDVEAPPAQEAGLSPDVLQQWRTKQLARFGQVCG